MCLVVCIIIILGILAYRFKLRIQLVLLFPLIAEPVFAADPSLIGKDSSIMDSRYSPLWKECAEKRIKIEEGYEAVEAHCRGDSGYDLVLREEDIRQSVTVISPDGKSHPIELDQIVSAAPSFLGEKAEWRRQKIGDRWTPFALILRFTTYSYEGDKKKKTSYLIVSKITPEKICVTDVIPPGRDQNELARQAGDYAAKKPCLE